MRPVEAVRKLCPKARPNYIAAFENGDALFLQHGVTTPLRLAHFLAQCLHETGGLRIERESGAYSAQRLMQIFGVGKHSAKVTPEEAARLAGDGPAIFERVYGLGNLKKARELGNTKPGDGYRYRGGGILQTTGRANYRRMGNRCGVDFEAHPDLIVSPAHALKPALAEWTEGNLNALADQDDLRAITKRINGGYNGLADRMAWLQRAKATIDRVDFGAEPEPEPETPREPSADRLPPIPPTPLPPAPVKTRPWWHPVSIGKSIWTWITGGALGFAWMTDPWAWVRAAIALGAFLLVAALIAWLVALATFGRARTAAWIKHNILRST
jgi:putative chitinase